jgi:hypothetical protein
MLQANGEHSIRKGRRTRALGIMLLRGPPHTGRGGAGAAHLHSASYYQICLVLLERNIIELGCVSAEDLFPVVLRHVLKVIIDHDRRLRIS